MEFFVYILRCSNGALYTGYTNDVLRRYREHQQGSAKCKFTRSFPPVELEAIWCFETAREARQFEASTKKLSKQKKLDLIRAIYESVR